MSHEAIKDSKNPISWMISNHVAANLLMLLFIVGGIIMGFNMKQEVMPEVSLDRINVVVAYPGSGPEEVEEGIILKIEDKLTGLEGIKKMTSTASEGSGKVTLELYEGVDVDTLVQEIKSEVDQIDNFPEDAERPTVTKLTRRNDVMSVAVYGKLDDKAVREYADRVKDDLLDMKEISQVELSAEKPFEITVEVPEQQLKKYNLTLSKVAAIIKNTSIDLPAGSVKESGGEILLRTSEKRYKGLEYHNIPIVVNSDGTFVRLGDIASITDGFADIDLRAEFDGQNAININIYRVGDEKPLDIAAVVKKYIIEKREVLPAGVNLEIWYDSSEILKDRMELLINNAYLGLGLVIITLAFFLQIRLAFWVSMGIPISFLGAFLVLPNVDVSINMISLFAFIMALGIVVDDAIIIGENIFTHRRMGKSPLQASIDGTKEVMGAVTFSVLTTVAAFTPLMYVTGVMGKFISNIPYVVITVLLVSLVEAFFILPAHLSGVKKPKESGLRDRLTHAIDRFINGPVRLSIELAVKFRYAVVVMSVVVLFLTVALMKSGVVKFRFFPDVEGDTINVELGMPYGTPVDVTARNTEIIVAKGMELIKKYEDKYGEGNILRNKYKVVGATFGRSGMKSSQGHLSTVIFYFHPADKRILSTNDFVKEWRKSVGALPGSEYITFASSLMNFGDNIDVRLDHKDFDVLEEAADRLKAEIKKYNNVGDIQDSFATSKEEIKFSLTPEGRVAGLTEADLAKQVRAAFYGVEALSFQRGKNEVEVNVMYPKKDRYSFEALKKLNLRTDAGVEIPFTSAAKIERGRGYSEIKRSEGKRVINVTANAAEPANPEEILAELSENFIPQMVADYPGMTWKLEGESERRKESMDSMKSGFLMAILVIYALLAIPFKSYFQPLLVMSAIPFGVVGAILGHFVMGYDVSIMSIFGIVALSGVVVNDSLVLIVFVNKAIEEGSSFYDAVVQSGVRRFRPIILTSLTTFFGLFPMLNETSLQARFLIPMAISLAYGILFATIITLFLVPSMYMITGDILGFFKKVYGSGEIKEEA